MTNTLPLPAVISLVNPTVSSSSLARIDGGGGY